VNDVLAERQRRVVVTGAGGFIGHHLVTRLKAAGHWVRGVDVKHPEFEPSYANEFILADLRVPENCANAVQGVQDVYQLAADMGGIAYISSRFARLSRSNVLINANMLEASTLEGVERYLFTSSACIYPGFLQRSEDAVALRETDDIPADPEKGYGWEKLFSEQLTRYYHEDEGLDVRIARFHNIFGPLGTFEGGREKAPAAICRKVAEALDGSTIEIWGDGLQARSFCYVDDCTEGIVRLMASGYTQPVNIGTDELVTIDRLADLICEAAGKNLVKIHATSQPQGVRGRNSDNTVLRRVTNWEPQMSLRDGLARTYAWIWTRLELQGRANPPMPQLYPSVPIEIATNTEAARPAPYVGGVLSPGVHDRSQSVPSTTTIEDDHSH